VRKTLLPSSFIATNNDRPDTSGARIRATRVIEGLTIRQLASLCGITPEALSLIERDGCTVSMPTIRQLSAMLKKPISYLGKFEDLPEDSLGQRIKKSRLYRGMSKTEFARVLGVDVKSVHNWETTGRVPSINVRSAIEEQLSILSGDID